MIGTPAKPPSMRPAAATSGPELLVPDDTTTPASGFAAALHHCIAEVDRHADANDDAYAVLLVPASQRDVVQAVVADAGSSDDQLDALSRISIK